MKNKLLKAINKNSTIGIVAPASPEENEFINKKINDFTSLGFKIKKGNYIYKKFNYLAGLDKERADDINDMFKDDSIDAIICLRGGYGSIRMLPYLDTKSIKKNPKPLIGYSDITLLLNYISSQCKFATFHGPMITSNFNDKITKQYFLNNIMNLDNKLIYNMEDLSENNHEIWNKKDFEGKIVGGNLSLICSSIGTPYEIDTNNKILLIEDVNEYPYVVDRMLSQLFFCGKLNKVCGIIIGYFTNCDDIINEVYIKNILKEKLINLNIPIIYNLKIGHSYPNITIPIGTKFEYNSTKNLLIQKESIFY